MEQPDNYTGHLPSLRDQEFIFIKIYAYLVFYSSFSLRSQPASSNRYLFKGNKHYTDAPNTTWPLVTDYLPILRWKVGFSIVHKSYHEPCHPEAVGFIPHWDLLTLHLQYKLRNWSQSVLVPLGRCALAQPERHAAISPTGRKQIWEQKGRYGIEIYHHFTGWQGSW